MLNILANPWTVSCVLGENGELGKEEEEARDELRFHTKVVDEEVEPGRERERERGWMLISRARDN